MFSATPTLFARLLFGCLISVAQLAAAGDADTVPCHTMGRWRNCVAVDLDSVSRDEAEKNFDAPQKGYAKIYIYRTTPVRPRSKSEVFLDDVALATLGVNTYAAFDITPGKHSLHVKTKDNAAIDINVEEGHRYFIDLQLEFLFWRNSERLELTDEATAKAQIMKSRLVKKFTD
ncbi:DUF2846 domain-containing protein [Undibacterium rugosum]|uniref:DUF2846 domain-containing protein n=1 Tax=Undibacterium rugosum TaxID=2762291 RepID=A0A923I312_9BURK|nr:DUF2846 domain-containing protein [Undibacterium rugosum]MBC3936854.1 DUF2846 domain-containing protein [Undibacterium rugosum]MBR7780165.1 DUF2846 domain-containing protein [Undibacterium rugosum]